MDYSVLNKKSSPTADAASTSSTGAGSSAQGSAESFLKLLVTQMQNQDPLNPMDNAQVTSQIAQINTVNGISTLNTTVSSLNSQFLQMQSLQGASLVGRDVLIEGNKLSVAEGKGTGTFELAGAADNVQVEVLSAAGKVVGSTSLGAETGGRHEFQIDTSGIANPTGLTFRITAKSGATAVASTTLVADKVESVSLDGDTLNVDLVNNGSMAYNKVKAFN